MKIFELYIFAQGNLIYQGKSYSNCIGWYVDLNILAQTRKFFVIVAAESFCCIFIFENIFTFHRTCETLMVLFKKLLTNFGFI